MATWAFVGLLIVRFVNCKRGVLVAVFSCLLVACEGAPLESNHISKQEDPRINGPQLDGPQLDSSLYQSLDPSFSNINGLDLHVLEQGSGESVVLLHGFPYFAGSWQPLMDRLSDNFHVVALEQRGYGYSGKPSSLDHYQLQYLVEDVRRLIELKTKTGNAIVIGHDWGGVVAWALAQRYPQLVEQLIVINAPPLEAFLYSLKHHSAQREASSYLHKLNSWYVRLLFAIKGAEMLWSDNMQFLLEQGKLSEDFKQAFLAAWSQPGAAQAAVNWYTANIPEFDSIMASDYRLDEENKISTPSLLIWSKRDKAFTLDTFNEIPRWVENLQTVILNTESHTPHFEQLDKIENLIQAFIQNGQIPVQEGL